MDEKSSCECVQYGFRGVEGIRWSSAENKHAGIFLIKWKWDWHKGDWWKNGKNQCHGGIGE